MNRLFLLISLFLLVYTSLRAEESPFFFTRQIMESHLSSYSEEERSAIAQDLAVVGSVCFSDLKDECGHEHPFYLATAGAPGARKSTILERFLKSHAEFGNAVYLDPDQRGLKFMVHTYHKRSLCALATAECQEYTLVEKKAYGKWRGASNYITVKLIEEALRKRFNVIHGTTSTGNHIPAFFEKLHAGGYKIALLLCYCEDEFRKKAVAYRNAQQRFYQATPADFVEKGKLFSQKFKDYFANAEQLYLFWSEDLFTPECLAAVYTGSVCCVHDDDAFRKFIGRYEQDKANLKKDGINIPSWQELENLRSQSYANL